MDPTFVGIVGLAFIIILMMQRVPVAMAMMVVGFGGIIILNSWQSALANARHRNVEHSHFLRADGDPVLRADGKRRKHVRHES